MICKIDEHYFVWSKIVDANVTRFMTREELVEYVQEQNGRRGVESLERSLTRVDKTGTSSMIDNDVWGSVWLNRAGRGGTMLAKSQLVHHIRHCCDAGYVAPVGVEPEKYPGNLLDYFMEKSDDRHVGGTSR